MLWLRNRSLAWMLAVGATYLLLGWPAYADNPTPKKPPPADDSDVHGGVAVNGHLARQSVRVNSKVHFWINVENHTNDDLSEIQVLTGFTPGLELDTSDGSTSLPAGHSLVLSGVLKAVRPDGLQESYLTLRWKQKDKESRAVVQLGPTEVISGWLYPFTWFLGKPEVTIPAALTLLTLLAGWWVRGRQERAQTWNTMLLESQKASMHYFMPAASRIMAATASLQAYRKDRRKTILLQKSFYYMVMFHKIHQQTFKKIGAYHFQSRFGEDILRLLFAQHKALFVLYQGTHELVLDRVLNLVSGEITLAEFLEMIEIRNRDAGAAWNLFRDWADDPSKDNDCKENLNVLEAYSQILVYEVNRPHLNWYGVLEPIQGDRKMRKELQKTIMAVVGNDREMRGRAERYLFWSRYAKADDWRVRIGYGVGKVWSLLRR